MNKTYQTTGINLKSSPIGEADRLLTILTPEHGLLRVIATGARKPKSSLGGRSGLFVVNQLLIARGKSLDRITQAETLHTYRHLASDLSKLSTSQYWAEIVLSQALYEQPQPDLYALLNVHLTRLDALAQSTEDVLAHLCQGIFHLLAVGGVAPQVHNCCLTRQPLVTKWSDPHWQTGFSIDAGGAVASSVLANRATGGWYILSGLELWLFQRLADPDLANLHNLNHDSGVPVTDQTRSPLVLQQSWLKIERILRQYIQHHVGTSIRSAALLMAGN